VERIDSIILGNGSDTLYDSDQGVYIDGLGDNDTIYALGGDDLVNGNGNNDYIDGGAGDDYLLGSSGDDELYGGAQDDYLQGHYGSDVVHGGDGDDLLHEGFIEDGSDAAWQSVADGGDGNDTLSFYGLWNGNTSPLGITFSLASEDPQRITMGPHRDFGVVTAINVENLVGTNAQDYLTGNDSANAIDASFGNDQIFGEDGDDFLIGNLGVDYIDGGAGIDTAGYDRYDWEADIVVRMLSPGTNKGNATGDTLVSIENLSGSQFGDVLGGDNNANTLWGKEGSDLLQGEGGDDILVGGDGVDTLAGGAGTDTADYSASAIAVIVQLALGLGAGGDAEGDSYGSIEAVIGSAFNDSLSGRDYVTDTLNGGDGDDLLTGRYGADVLNGGDGRDTLSYVNSLTGVEVRLFNGVAAGGEANGDTFSSIENIVGSSRTDTLAGDAIANQIWAGDGNDGVSGREGNDALRGELGNDVLQGGAGEDYLIGGAGADSLGGGADDDLVDYSASDAGVTINLATGAGTGGHAQDDYLASIEDVIGSAFNDIIIGKANAWDNVFDGGGGNDTITGGLGNDRFVFRMGDGSDTVTDFTAGGSADHVRLAGWGASFDTFAEVIAAADQVGADTVIDFGNGQTLTLQNVTLGNLTSADFLFGA
jgi:Ca2+-binding RTX toxin-like protein